MDHGISMSAEAWNAPPHINWRHIDGPMMSWRGEVYWLSWRDRLSLWFGLTGYADIARRAFPDRA